MNKKVLLVVRGGVASVYADYGVDVVCVDLDDAKVMAASDMMPIHSSFVPLMEFAAIYGEWPASDVGRVDDAEHFTDKDPQQEIYVAGQGLYCPECSSEDITSYGALETDGGDALRNCYCTECKSSWRDHYHLVGFEELCK